MAKMSDLMSQSVNKVTNRYLDNKSEGLKLITNLISADNSNGEVESHLRELEVLIKNDFLTLAEKDKCPGSAGTFEELQKTYQDLVDIVSFPELENKFTVAVGGQFSAGKSKFLNCLLNSKNLLPTDTSATTSIPTYILPGDKDTIFALNNYQHKTEIDEEALQAISHAFKDVYDISFSHILKLIAVERTSFKWKNLTFLDTPGYSKADSIKNRNDNTDENIAREHLRTADYLIWLIDIQNGTIPEEDIQFIRSLDYEGKTLFVFNKADKKTEEQINSVISVTKENLEKNEIEFFDIIGFSSNRNEEYSEKKDVLKSFLAEISDKTPGTKIHKQFERILEDYLNFHKSEIELLRISRGTVNEATVDARVGEKYGAKLKLTTKKQQKQISVLKESKNEFTNLKEKITIKVEKIFKELNFSLQDGYIVERRKRPRKTKEIFKINAMITVKNTVAISSLIDIKKIKGRITKIAKIGITAVSEYGDDIFVPSKNLKEYYKDYKISLYVEKKILIDYLGNNQAVVTIES